MTTPGPVFVEDVLVHLGRDHVRIVVSLLLYGTLTALERWLTTIDTAYRVVPGWPVMLYFKDRLKPRDRILEEALSYSIELDTISRHIGPHQVVRACAAIKSELIRWWARHLKSCLPSRRARPQTVDFRTRVPLEKALSRLTKEDHVRRLVAFLAYGTLAALKEERITSDVAARVVLNRPVLRFLKEKLRPRDRALEKALAEGVELAAGKTAGERELLRACEQIEAQLVTLR